MEASVSEQDLSQNIELSADEQAQLKALDESLVKFEGLKRWSDVIKTLIARGELHKDPAKKVENFSRAGELYIEKSSNQAEAIKAYARVLEIDRENVDAITRLKDMYEKRREWEKLVDVMRLEIDLMDELGFLTETDPYIVEENIDALVHYVLSIDEDSAYPAIPAPGPQGGSLCPDVFPGAGYE